VTPLVREWIDQVREDGEATDRDRLVYAEARDHRVPHERSVVVGGLVDGRSGKPGVLLHALTSDGWEQTLGVSNVEHARAVIEAIRMAWPELRDEPKGEA
jgi:hypothetical protein